MLARVVDLLGWLYFPAQFEFHDLLMLGKSIIKWRQHPDMGIAVHWDTKLQTKQTNLISMQVAGYSNPGASCSKLMMSIVNDLLKF